MREAYPITCVCVCVTPCTVTASVLDAAPLPPVRVEYSSSAKDLLAPEPRVLHAAKSYASLPDASNMSDLHETLSQIVEPPEPVFTNIGALTNAAPPRTTVDPWYPAIVRYSNPGRKQSLQFEESQLGTGKNGEEECVGTRHACSG